MPPDDLGDVADRHALVGGDADQGRHEAVISFAVHYRGSRSTGERMPPEATASVICALAI